LVKIKKELDMTKVIFEDTGKYSIEEVLEKLREMGVDCRIEGDNNEKKESRLTGLLKYRDIDATELGIKV
jgi:hypothetical protein